MTRGKFEDIKIVELDDWQTQRSSRGGEIWDVYLTLSAPPPAQWAKAFDAEWSSVIYSSKRNARISGQAIHLEAPLDEVERVHKQQLQEAVEKANAAYRDYLARIEAEGEHALEKVKEDNARVAELRDRLTFD